MHFSKRSIRKYKIQRKLRGTSALLQGIITDVCAVHFSQPPTVGNKRSLLKIIAEKLHSRIR